MTRSFCLLPIVALAAALVAACGGRTGETGDPTPGDDDAGASGGTVSGAGGRRGSGGRTAAGGRLGAGGALGSGGRQCGPIGCLPLACPEPQYDPDACCPVCDGALCAEGQAQYRELVDSLLAQPEATFCQSDADCTAVYLASQCAMGCGHIVSVQFAEKLLTTTEDFAMKACGSCSPQPPPPCPAPPPFACYGGYCSFPQL